MKRVVALGAHYDDIEIGCGGTLKQHVDNNDNVQLVILNPENERLCSPKIRLIEQQTSLRKLGLTKNNLTLINSTNNKYENIVKQIDDLKPDIIFLPYWNDSHQDHKKVSEIGQSILRNKNITGYFYMSGSTINFNPIVYNIIDINFKHDLLKSFSSQLKSNLNINLILSTNKMFGSMITEKTDYTIYTEAFFVRRIKYSL